MSKRKLDPDAYSPSLDAVLAELLALLDPAPFSTDACVSALRRAKGDVSAAAELLLIGGGGEGSSSSSAVPTPTSTLAPRKRPKQGGLKAWFSAPKSEPGAIFKSGTPSPPSHSSNTPPRKPSRTTSPAPPSPVNREASAANWAALLSRPSSSPVPKEKVRAAPQRPAFLATPAAVVASGLPIALLQSPLTPSFAAQLFHELMAESPKWGRNKFFIAGREAESNHQATSYTREGEDWGPNGPSAYFYNGVEYHSKVSWTQCES